MICDYCIICFRVFINDFLPDMLSSTHICAYTSTHKPAPIHRGSDGLIKMWTIKTNECTKTLDAHDQKIWALAVNQNESVVVTGAADSNIIVWKVSEFLICTVQAPPPSPFVYCDGNILSCCVVVEKII